MEPTVVEPCVRGASRNNAETILPFGSLSTPGAGASLTAVCGLGQHSVGRRFLRSGAPCSRVPCLFRIVPRNVPQIGTTFPESRANSVTSGRALKTSHFYKTIESSWHYVDVQGDAYGKSIQRCSRRSLSDYPKTLLSRR